ncbi:MerR family transcriptional regulator [Noviherbaspirillum pedocola]|nr:MerR family transcriptional regulator [Noviherbaspirillum pedocola]
MDKQNAMQRGDTAAEPGRAAYKSGVAARLAGLSAETLRVWERRYQLSDTKRSSSGQRLYSPEQVRRLSLLKQLVDQGHAIGVLANLPIEQLQELAGVRVNERSLAGPIRVVVVGESLARRIASGGREGLEIAVQCSCPRLETAATLTQDADVEVLLIEQSELNESALPLIAAARAACAATAVVVLYRFCASATIRALRTQGCLVARIPAELGELVLLCRSALSGERLAPLDRPDVPAVRFDEEALSVITAAGSSLDCECPRHLADLLSMVGSFERYSAQCANRNADDAQLHQELQHAAGRARAILEAAMERLMRAEGIPLPRQSRQP